MVFEVGVDASHLLENVGNGNEYNRLPVIHFEQLELFLMLGGETHDLVALFLGV